jgi:hypothetical protein
MNMSSRADFRAGYDHRAEECERHLSSSQSQLIQQSDKSYKGDHSKPVINPKQFRHEQLDITSQADGNPCQR